MPETGVPFDIFLVAEAAQDLRDVLRWGHEQFGDYAGMRYSLLLQQAFRDIAMNPARHGSRETPELGQNLRSYHLSFSKERARSALGIVRNPRHFLIYRLEGPVVQVFRILHDSMDLATHLPRSTETS